ncbi:hypothetical protein JRO89_XS15G0102400 [Xanthoceras sorbifolium]|uniref:SP-RING-type domain-containing protein n=1 Tax=Xanthoceras sorbifolium TaxID=99658 RepID=A0ABQ8H1K2_9ROSI|nr:hypothetical protein JRO89_XS15G0102400 [Xanthoceras sorbifolium]
MASTSAYHADGVAGKIRNAAATICNDNQSLIVEARKVLAFMKEVAVDLERENKSQMVKEVEDAAIQLAETYGDCMLHSSAIESIGNSYQPGTELTDFKKLLMDEFAKRKASSSSVPEKDPLIRHFREAVWNVHHAGEPMPGEEQDDIIMTSTQCNLLNITCPLSGKPISELAEPVRRYCQFISKTSWALYFLCWIFLLALLPLKGIKGQGYKPNLHLSVECKHIYEKKAIMAYIKSKQSYARCPIAGCPKILQAAKVVCDAFLLIEIEELKSMSKQTARTDVIEDFTALDEDDE